MLGAEGEGKPPLLLCEPELGELDELLLAEELELELELLALLELELLELELLELDELLEGGVGGCGVVGLLALGQPASSRQAPARASGSRPRFVCVNVPMCGLLGFIGPDYLLFCDQLAHCQLGAVAGLAQLAH